MDTLVFDIETSNFFTDPGVGWDNFGALRISVVGVYSYDDDAYYCYEEKEMDKIAELFSRAKTIVGFSMNRYDVPVLNSYFQKMKIAAPNLWSKDRVDLLEEIEVLTSQRISLSRLAEANLGVKKEANGAAAIKLFEEGKITELKEYCLNDVRLTKALYDLYRTQNYFLVPDKRTGETVKVSFVKQSVTPRLL